MDEETGGTSAWKYIGIGCGIAALLGVCGLGACVACVGVGGGAAVMTFGAPLQSAAAFADHVRHDELADAYALTTTTYQAAHSLEDFTTSLHANPALAESTGMSTTQVDVHVTTARIGGLLEGEERTAYALDLVLEGDAWHVAQLELQGTPIL